MVSSWGNSYPKSGLAWSHALVAREDLKRVGIGGWGLFLWSLGTNISASSPVRACNGILSLGCSSACSLLNIPARILTSVHLRGFSSPQGHGCCWSFRCSRSKESKESNIHERCFGINMLSYLDHFAGPSLGKTCRSSLILFRQIWFRKCGVMYAYAVIIAPGWSRRSICRLLLALLSRVTRETTQFRVLQSAPVS